MRYSELAKWIAWYAALAPLIAVHLGYAINILSGGVEACFPYWDGCTSISRAARSGPGLMVFRGLVIPSGVALAATWWLLRDALAASGSARQQELAWMLRLGVSGALFLILYATYLGESGPIYRWLRRYGVYGYFGCTALAQLVLLKHLPSGFSRGVSQIKSGVVTLWVLGVGFAFHPLLVSNPATSDRLRNAVEWIFALLMTLVLIKIAGLLRSLRVSLKVEVP